ncbi:MAG: hypothetical protein JO053_12915 [Acidobacteria bacterium]|nr:hypothetical protein [Acidobacteriota bacterium]
MRKQILLALAFVLLLAGAAAAQKSFYNKEFKFGFKSPVGTKLKTDADSLFASDPLKAIVNVELTNPGRGLFDAEATISAAQITKDACHALSTADDKPTKKKFGTNTFEMTEEIEGGMESVHPQEFYRTFHNGVCYEVRIIVGMEKYPKRRVSERPAFERMYAILRTFYFK